MDAEACADVFPWLVFLVIDRKSGLGVAWAGGAALVCSAALVAWSYLRGRTTLVPRVGTALFAALLVSGLAVHSWNEQVSLSRALALVSLSLLAFASLRFTPLSEPYAVRMVAPAVRRDPRFDRVNVEITLAWGVGSLAVAGATATTAVLPSAVAFTFLDWVTPIVLAAATILWATRRWERFRLAVDVVDEQGAETAFPPPGAVRRGRAQHAGAGVRHLVPVESSSGRAGWKGESNGGSHEAGAEAPPEAIIRRLASRRSNGSALPRAGADRDTLR